MKYVLADNSRVDFLARATLHSFKGWANNGLRAEAEIDMEQGILHRLWAEVDTSCFDTADPERTEAMNRYLAPLEHPRVEFSLSECREFSPAGNGRWQIRMLGVLDYVDIRRQLPVFGLMRQRNGRLLWDLHCKWSFKAYGLKPPRLFFLTVHDIVDISAHLEFTPVITKEENDVHL